MFCFTICLQFLFICCQGLFIAGAAISLQLIPISLYSPTILMQVLHSILKSLFLSSDIWAVRISGRGTSFGALRTSARIATRGRECRYTRASCAAAKGSRLCDRIGWLAAWA
jgi:hypothetical protein